MPAKGPRPSSFDLSGSYTTSPVRTTNQGPVPVLVTKKQQPLKFPFFGDPWAYIPWFLWPVYVWGFVDGKALSLHQTFAKPEPSGALGPSIFIDLRDSFTFDIVQLVKPFHLTKPEASGWVAKTKACLHILIWPLPVVWAAKGAKRRYKLKRVYRQVNARRS